MGKTSDETAETSKIGAILPIISLVLLTLLIGAGVFVCLTLKKNADVAEQNANLQNRISSQDQKITTLEEKLAKNTTPQNNQLDFKVDELSKLIYSDSNNDSLPDYGIEKIYFIKVSKDNKYLYARFGMTPLIKSPYLKSNIVMAYRTLPDGAWKDSGLQSGSVSNCSVYNQDLINIFIDLDGGTSEKCTDDKDNMKEKSIKEHRYGF